MSERRLTSIEAAIIGAALVEARAARVPWKDLTERYGLGRTRLWMLWRDAVARKKDVHEHRRAGQGRGNGRMLAAS